MYFAATVLSLSVIFGSGWAAGVGKINAAKDVTTRIIEPVSDEECPDCPDNNNQTDKCPDCPSEEQHGKTTDHIRFRFKMPAPADFRDRIINLPYKN